MRGPLDENAPPEPDPIPLTTGEQMARVLMVASPFLLAALIWLVLRAVST